MLFQAFDSYRVYIYSQLGTYHASVRDLEATIVCFRGPDPVAELKFYRDGAALPQNSEAGTILLINYHIRQFDRIYLLLLNEKPLHAFVRGDGLYGYVGTSENEPIGDLETT